MKKVIIICALFFGCSSSIFAQIEDTTIEEVVIDKVSTKVAEGLIQKVVRQIYDNYSLSTSKYQIFQESIINDQDTLISSNQFYNVSIDLRNKKINKVSFKHQDSKEKLNSEFLSRYPGSNDSPLYWVTEIILRKYVNVPELDVFTNYAEYNFTKEVRNGLTKISFYSDGYYSGFFIIDKNYNLRELKLQLDQPYPIDHSQSKNGKKSFVKNWEYKRELLWIKFGFEEQRIAIKELEAFEEIRDYNFVKYDKTGKVIVRDDNLNFKSKLIFKKI